ncbi:MAG TPA: sigma-54 dependent transcriptional regulator [Blastocatellia bacterium]|jgi:Nif-specific regulatory protein|nr:sigma-54 dependent transcriptional regulator [Blastocatellia bacterium]
MRQVQNMATLTEIRQHLSTSGSLRDVIREVLEILAKEQGVVRAAVHMRQPESDEVKVVGVHGLPSQENKLRRWLLKSGGETVIQDVMRSGRIAIFPASGLRLQSRSQSSILNRPNAGITFLCLPILSNQRAPMGAISVELSFRSGHDANRTQEMLRVIASVIAQAFTVHNLLETATERLMAENANLRDELSERYDFSSIIGKNWRMQQVFEQVAQVASANTTVLIEGESGTGKELVARALHINSGRASQPFIKANCAALPEGLIEAEMFGHEPGAFTGANQRRLGRFDLAAGGTLFLDEIGELSQTVQVRLPRVLQTRQFERVGGVETINADVRMIAATSRNLQKEVAEGRFRADLYYCLNVFPITVPPLRDRGDDIGLLAEHFLAKCAREQGKSIRSFAPRAQEMLQHYPWPGNVRELENTIQHVVVVTDGDVVQHYHLPPALQTVNTAHKALNTGLFESVEAYEKDLVCEALRKTRGSRSQAAKLLKVSERVLSYKVKKYEIDCAAFRSSK